MADVYKISATLDAEGVKQGAREIEQALDKAEASANKATTGATPAEATAIKATTAAIKERTQATQQLVAQQQTQISLEQRASMMLGSGVALAQIGGSALGAIGQERAGTVLESAASNAMGIGMMMAPLGLQAAILGTAMGGLAGVITSLMDTMEDVESKALANLAAELTISKREYDGMTAEQQSAVQAGIKDLIADTNMRMGLGAEISAADVTTIAQWDTKTARKALDYYAGSGGEMGPEMRMLSEALDIVDWDRRMATHQEMLASDDGGSYYNRNQGTIATDRKIVDDATKYFADVVALARDGGNGLTAIDVGEAGGQRVDLATKAMPKGGGLTGLSVDSLQSVGMGVYSNPMRRTEQLLESIDHSLETINRKRVGGVLL